MRSSALCPLGSTSDWQAVAAYVVAEQRFRNLLGPNQRRILIAFDIRKVRDADAKVGLPYRSGGAERRRINLVFSNWRRPGDLRVLVLTIQRLLLPPDSLKGFPHVGLGTRRVLKRRVENRFHDAPSSCAEN
jgi:hypothetical protein